MSQLSGSLPRPSARAWAEALTVVVAALAAMGAVGALGLWAAGAADLPSGAFPAVLAATVAAAVGGTVDVTGGAGVLGRTGATLAAVPLSVTLAGALAAGAALLRPPRHGPPSGPAELPARAARAAVLWLLALLPVARAARHTFRIGLGSSLLDELGAALGAEPTVGFRADVGATLGWGLVWLLVVCAVAVCVSGRTPLPAPLLRLRAVAGPAVRAVAGLLLGYVLLGLVVGVVVLCTRGHTARTAAVLLLGLPNLAWLALGVGLGGAWKGSVPGGGIGLPMPRALAAVLQEGGGEATVDLTSLSRHDGRTWVLVAVAAVALVAAGFLTARAFPAPLWWQGVRLAVVLALGLWAAGAATGLSARYGLSLLGIGELDAFGHEVRLYALLPRLTGLGALWGLAAGLLGGVLARVVPAGTTRG
ncbi:streptophobe family protein [Streptomyces luteireticuli]|uniref:Streptophobe family protein n=1 Tax=Streptomyces luteireticuli TaxID=173858 RepID=A0ABN0YYU1_9ACTN